MKKNSMIAGILAVLIVLAIAALLLPNYVAYVSRRSQEINEEISAREELEAREARAIGGLRTLLSAINTFREEHKRLPHDQADLESSGLIDPNLFNEIHYAYVRMSENHFYVLDQAGQEFFCADESEIVRLGGISKDNQCIGKEVK